MRIQKKFKHDYNPTQRTVKKKKNDDKHKYKAILVALIMIAFGFFGLLLITVASKITIPFR